jgi:hypothetical protein
MGCTGTGYRWQQLRFLYKLTTMERRDWDWDGIHDTSRDQQILKSLPLILYSSDSERSELNHLSWLAVFFKISILSIPYLLLLFTFSRIPPTVETLSSEYSWVLSLPVGLRILSFENCKRQNPFLYVYSTCLTLLHYTTPTHTKERNATISHNRVLLSIRKFACLSSLFLFYWLHQPSFSHNSDQSPFVNHTILLAQTVILKQNTSSEAVNMKQLISSLSLSLLGIVLLLNGVSPNLKLYLIIYMPLTKSSKVVNVTCS